MAAKASRCTPGGSVSGVVLGVVPKFDENRSRPELEEVLDHDVFKEWRLTVALVERRDADLGMKWCLAPDFE